jgi:hypothetical protein
MALPLRWACHIQGANVSACPGEWDPVRQGEPLFAGKDMRQHENLQRISFILDH